MVFEEIPGQERVKERLATTIAEGRLPHASLFLGPRGSGKLALALATAQRLLCSARHESAPCAAYTLQPDASSGTLCPNCRKAARLVHPDLHFAFPTIGRKATGDAFLPTWRTCMQENPWLDLNAWLQAIGAENQQGNITAEACQHIARKLSLKPFEAPYKVLVLWMPELLGNEGNRLLKLIEEPPEATFFMLVAEDTDRILPTLLSRCQLIQLGPLSDEEVEAGLRQRFPQLRDRARAMAFQAHGNFDEALRLAEEREDDNSTRFVQWLRLCYLGDGVKLVGWTEDFARLGRENQKHFLQYGLQFLRELIVMKVLGEDHVRLGQQERATAAKLQALIPFGQAEALAGVLSEAMLGVERNGNPKILFLDTSLQVSRIMKRQEVAPSA